MLKRTGRPGLAVPPGGAPTAHTSFAGTHRVGPSYRRGGTCEAAEDDQQGAERGGSHSSPLYTRPRLWSVIEREGRSDLFADGLGVYLSRTRSGRRASRTALPGAVVAR